MEFGATMRLHVSLGDRPRIRGARFPGHRTIRFSQGAILYQLWRGPISGAIFEPSHEFGLASATSY
jgi:hypothetical protein